MSEYKAKRIIVEKGKPKSICIKPYTKYVNTSWGENIKATRVPIPYSTHTNSKGETYKLRIFSTDRCLIEIKDDENISHYESNYTLNDLMN